MDKKIETESFIANVRKGAGAKNTTLEITIDYRVAQYIGLQTGDKIKVYIKKLTEQKK